MSMIPRICGKVGQADSPPDVAGKWFFEIFIGELGGGEPESVGMFGPWETEAIAKEELRNACRLACEAYEKLVDGKPSGKYIDMKANVTRRWDRSDEQ